MPDKEFDSHKESLATQRSEKPKSMRVRCAAYGKEIRTQQYNFDRDNIEVDFLKTITRERILEFFDVISISLILSDLFFK